MRIRLILLLLAAAGSAGCQKANSNGQDRAPDVDRKSICESGAWANIEKPATAAHMGHRWARSCKGSDVDFERLLKGYP